MYQPKDHYAQLAWIVGIFTIIVFTALHIENLISIKTLIFVIITSIGNVALIKITNKSNDNLHSFHEEVTKPSEGD